MSAVRGASVSIVIPCYNQGVFVADAIRSALAQRAVGVEVIVVNDGSTDHTAAVVGAFSKVTLLEQENRGLSAARNAGLAVASGEYIIFCDADDRLLRNAAALGARALQQDVRAAVAFGRARVIDETGAVITEQDASMFAGLADEGGLLYERLLRGNVIYTTGCAVFRRSVFDEVGGFESGIDGAADYDMWLRVARVARMRPLQDVVLEYRLHGGNMSDDLELMSNHVRAALERQAEFALASGRAASLQVGMQHFADEYSRRLGSVAAHRAELHAGNGEVGLDLADVVVGLDLEPGRRLAVACGTRTLTGGARAGVVSFPVLGDPSDETLFASGVSGSAVAAWLAVDRCYDFTLRNPGGSCIDHVRVAVRAGDPVVVEPMEDVRPPFLYASPNPAYGRRRLATAVLCWDTAGDAGNVSVVSGDLPGTVDEVLANVRKLRVLGVTDLLFPPSQSWWFEHFAGLRDELDLRFDRRSGPFGEMYDLANSTAGAAPPAS